MKRKYAAAFFLLLVSCEKSWTERRVPTTDAERQAVTAHVEKVLSGAIPANVAGDDQDLERLIYAAHQEARITLCRPTLWETDTSGSYTGRWKYNEIPAPFAQP